MNREELLDQLTQDVLAYAMHGAFPEREIARSIKPDGLDKRFEDYELLLDLHFVLKDDVVDFVRELPNQLRSIRTETETVSRTRRGTVDGQINWNATIKKRYSQNPNDSSLFVCDNRSEDYDIPENIVLKKLISVVYTTLREAEEYLRAEYDWVQDTWKGNEDLITEIQRIVERNVHVRRIREPETYEPTERMLTSAVNSRQRIYREAGSLLQIRDRLFRGDADETRTLLDETAITPDDDHTLFELFVLFRFVSTLEEMLDGEMRFKTIATGRQEIARMEGDKEIVLYHDNSAADRDLSFQADIQKDQNGELSRTEKVQTVARRVASDYFYDRPDFQNSTGRPDVIILEIIDEEAKQHEYLIAEVKNSRNIDTIRGGIKETLEYLAFLQVNDEFVFEKPDYQGYFGNNWNGLLVIQDLDSNTASVYEQADNEIKILQASEVDNELHEILSNVID